MAGRKGSEGLVQNAIKSSIPMDENLNLDREVAVYRRRAIVAVQVAFLVGAAIVLSVDVGSWPIAVGIAASMVLSAVSLRFALQDRFVVAASILAVQLLALPTYLSLRAMGTYDAAMLIFPAAMMAMSVVSKPRQTAAFAFVAMVCASAVAVATRNNWIGNKSFEEVIAKNPIDVIAVLVIVAFSAVVATYVSIILTGVLRKLADHQAALEHNIFLRTRELASSNDELRQAVRNLDRARAELVRGEKLAGLGSLVAGVAHELNTPIGNTAVAATTLQHDVDEFRRAMDAGSLRKSELQQFLARCNEGAELLVKSTQRAAELVISFKQVAVDQASDRRREFDLGETVQDVLRSIRPSFKGHAWVLETDIPQGIHCDGFPGPLGQIVSNLVQNAVLHGFAGREQGRVQVHATVLDADTVRLTVEDDGNGIPEASLGKIFDPFFTTRLGQGGSGLGLTIVYNLVTVMLGGRIEVRSSVGEGTCFTLTFPLSAPRNEG